MEFFTDKSYLVAIA